MKKYIDAFLTYAIDHHVITNFDVAKKNIAKQFDLTNYVYSRHDLPIDQVLEKILDIAYEKHLYAPNTTLERDAFEAYLFDLIMPSPHEVKQTFSGYTKKDKEKAFLYLYDLSKHVNYIKTKRIKQNIHFIYPSPYGDLQITINLSKPEKDPKDIAKALDINKQNIKGPKCVLCKENEQNYENARMNLRIVPIHLAQELWHFQYSPYLYFNEHSIILSDVHRDMKIDQKTFSALFDFIDYMPSYFVGSNADLPIVGGSILNHDHFQSGRHHFPIEDAKSIKTYDDLKDISISHLYWPLSTIRLISKNRTYLEDYAKHILDKWKTYQHEELKIIPFTNKPHQTITPIARFKNNAYELDLILRNNRTDETFPDGIFHPHQEYHHIKKENIGLIEAAGLAILPGRLKDELKLAYRFLTEGKKHPDLDKHMHWLIKLSKENQIKNIDDLYQEVGKIFTNVLENSGVFKLDKLGISAMDDFIKLTIDTYKKCEH